MTKTKHKILSVFLSFCMIISCMVGMSLTASADKATDLTGDCGTGVTYKLEDTNEDGNYDKLTISGNGAMDNYTDEYGDKTVPWYDVRNSVTSVVISNGVTEIGDYAFLNFDNLTSLSIADTVTNIGDSAFSNCGFLNTITIPSSITSIGSYAFYSSTAGRIVTFIRPESESSLTVADGAFYYSATLAYSDGGNYSLFAGDNEIELSGTLNGDKLNGKTLTWKLPIFSITDNSVNGSVTASVDGADVTSAEAGDTVTLTVKPDTGYKLKTISISTSKEKVEEFSDLVSLMGTAIFAGDNGYNDFSGYTCKVEDDKFVVYNGTTLVAETANISDFNVGNYGVSFYCGDIYWSFNISDNKITRIMLSDTSWNSLFDSAYPSESNGTLPPSNVELTTVTEGSKYSFTMPKKNVTVTAEFEESSHDHSFTYSASGATITATCSADDCPLTDSKATLTLVKPTLTTYGGTGDATATLTGLDAFNAATGLNVAATAIKYYEAEEVMPGYKRVGDELAQAPTGVGDYFVGLTLSNVKISESETEDVKVYVPYTIAKGAPTITTAPTASDITYGQQLSDSTLSGGVASVDGTFSWKTPTTAPTVADSNSTEYTVVFTPTDSTNYSAVETNVKVTVSKADPETPTGLTATIGQTLADVKLPDGWSWVDASTDVGAVGDNTFKANYTDTTGNYNNKQDVDLTVKVSAAVIPVTAIDLNYSTYSMKVGESNALSTSFTPADATDLTLTFASSDTSVVTISDIGAFTAVGVGTATLTVTATNGTEDTSDDVKATCVVTVTSSSGGNSGGYTPSPSTYIPSTTTTTTKTGSFSDETKENTNYAGAEINMKTEDLKKAVLTDEDKKVIAAGGDVTVELEVKEKTPTAEEKKAVEAAVEAAKEASGKDYTVAMYFDANLFKTSNGTKTQLHETNGKIAVSFKLPAQFKNTDSSVTRTYAVARIHDGKTEILVCEYDPETDLLTFYTDKFSTYALMYEDAKADDVDVSAVDDDDEQGDEGAVDDEQFDEADDEALEDDTDYDFAEDKTDGGTDDDVQAAVDAVVDTSDDNNPHTNAPLAGMGVFAVMSFFAAAAAYTAKKRKNK